MGSSKIAAPTIQLENVSIPDLKNYTIEDRSAGRAYGRRFVLINNAFESGAPSETKELTINEIFNHVSRLHKNCQTPADYSIIKAFLGNLKLEDGFATETYNAREDIWYKIRTCIHRLGNFTSLECKINNLLDKINKNPEAKDDIELKALSVAEIKRFPKNKRDDCLIKVATLKLADDRPLHAIEYMEAISDEKKKTTMAVEIAEKLYAKDIVATNDSHRVTAINLIDSNVKDLGIRQSVFLKLILTDSVEIGDKHAEWTKANVTSRITDSALIAQLPHAFKNVAV